MKGGKYDNNKYIVFIGWISFIPIWNADDGKWS